MRAGSSPARLRPKSVSATESPARKLALTFAGAVAFSRTVEPETSEFEDAVVLRTFGEVLSKEVLLSAG